MNLIEQVSAALEKKASERKDALEALEARQVEIEKINVEEKRTATDEELDSLKVKADELRAIENEIKELEERKAELETIEADKQSSASKLSEVRNFTSISNVKEPKVYAPESRHNFLADAYAFQFNPTAFEARERIVKHMAQAQEEFRDVGTSAFDGLTVPQYLTDLVAPAARAGRPFADIVNHQPLPDKGMTISISKITTGSDVAVQASENGAVNETNIDDTKLDVSVRTIAGQQDISRQALERSEGVGQLVLEDLIFAYHTKLDYGILNDDGTSGTHKGLRNVSSPNTTSYTDASPTVAELIPKLADAIQKVASNRYLPATGIIMHPRRWGWICAALDSSNRPLVVPAPSQVFNSSGNGEIGYGQGSVGSLLGLPVYVDANIRTDLGAGTEDEIYVTRLDQLLLWEAQGQPLGLKFEDVGSGTLTVRTTVYGYSAFTGERYNKSTTIISGTGLISPSF